MELDYAVKRLIESLAAINGTNWDLPKGALSRPSDIYVVTGRWDQGTAHPENDPALVDGNPIDIIVSYIMKNDYFSCNRYGEETNNAYANRRLILASELANNKQEWDFTKNVKFRYQNGVLSPEKTVIEPEKVDLEYELLDQLKTKEGFEEKAHEHTNAEKVCALLKHLF